MATVRQDKSRFVQGPGFVQRDNVCEWSTAHSMPGSLLQFFRLTDPNQKLKANVRTDSIQQE